MIVDNEFHFDTWLKDEMKKRGITQKQLAEKSYVTCATISYYMNNQKMPTVRTLDLLLNALDMHMEFLPNERR